MKELIMEVPADLIASTKMLNAYQRKNVLRANGYISDSLWYGYGVYGGAYIEDDTHVSMTVGDSCD